MGTRRSIGKSRAWGSYRDVGRDEQGWRAKLLMELVGGAAESSCLEKVVQHGSSDENKRGRGKS